MRYLLFTFLAFTLCACTPKPATMGKASGPADNASYLIGYTGGWGGGPAYKLEGGKLYESVDKHNPGNAEATVNDNTFEVLKSAAGLQAMIDLADDFDEDIVTDVPPGFDCPEMAYDGVCPYFIIVKDGKVRGWTMSEKGSYSIDFVDFMESVGEALTKM
jgi:hypothetical protein